MHNNASGPGPHDAAGTVMATSDRQFANTLARGFAVLRCFEVGAPILGNGDIVARTGLPKATVSRLTHTLTRLGYLRRNASLGKYELASAVLSLGYPLLGNMRLRRIARPLMQPLALRVKGSVNLGLRDRTSMVYVETCLATDALPGRPDLGSSIPLATSAMGRAWLAGATRPEREDAIRQLRHDLPDSLRTHRAAIDAAADEVRSRGFCASFGDTERGTWAVGVPLRRRAGDELLVLNCSLPAYETRRAALENDIGPRLVAVARSVEAAAGLR